MSDAVDDYRRERFLRFLDPSYGLPDPDDLARSDMTFTEAYNQIAAEGLSLESAVADATAAFQERMEKELFGAWRAGYDYLHVYDERGLSTTPIEHGSVDSVTFSQYVVPAHSEQPIHPPDLRYSHTYDLTSVPDHVMRAAWRDELDKYERIEPDDADGEVDFYD